MTSNLFQIVVTALNRWILGGNNQQQPGLNQYLQWCSAQILQTLTLSIATFKNIIVGNISNTGNAFNLDFPSGEYWLGFPANDWVIFE